MIESVKMWKDCGLHQALHEMMHRHCFLNFSLQRVYLQTKERSRCKLTSIRLILRGAKASAEVHGVLTAGMVGIPVTIEYDESWNGLSKNLVCRGGLGYDNFRGESRTFLGVGTTAKVAPEVLIAGNVLYLGIEGYNADGSLVIPTTWARCGIIQDGVKTEGGPSEDPTLPIWSQLQTQIDQLPESVEAIVEEKLKDGEFIGKAGNGIKSAVLNSDFTLTLHFDDGTSYTTSSIRGEPGEDYVLTDADKAEIAELVDTSQNDDGIRFCIIDATDGWDSIDKTYEEIQQAYADGAVILLYYAGKKLNLVSANDGFVFERYYVEGTKVITDRCSLDEESTFYVRKASVLDIPTDDHINDLIDAALGVIENGTY